MKRLKAALKASTSMIHMEVYGVRHDVNVIEAVPSTPKIINVLVNVKTAPALFTALTGRPHPSAQLEAAR